mmetsp:Transcript_4926/g.14379  ORF Transcript_4926/g.14379 Transcript_4926/m.14379 type:complete len:329 (+) Transcript_4926:228-1214(+)
MRLEENRPLDLQPLRRRRWRLGRPEHAVRVGEALQVGEYVAQLGRDLVEVRGRGLQAALDGVSVDADRRAMDGASGADLGALLLAGLGGTVARIAHVVRHPRRAEQRGVGGALVDDFDGEAEYEPQPSDDHDDEAALHIDPCRRLALPPQCAVHVRALLCWGAASSGGGRGRLDARLRRAQLSDDVGLAVLELLRRSNEPDGMLEGGGKAPLPRPPGRAGALGHGRRRRGGRAEPDELQRVHNMDGIRGIDEDEAHSLGLGGEPALVLDDGGGEGEPEREGAEAVEGEAARDDVEGQDDLLQDEHRQQNDDAREQGTGLLQLVANLHV